MEDCKFNQSVYQTPTMLKKKIFDFSNLFGNVKTTRFVTFMSCRCNWFSDNFTRHYIRYIPAVRDIWTNKRVCCLLFLPSSHLLSGEVGSPEHFVVSVAKQLKSTSSSCSVGKSVRWPTKRVPWFATIFARLRTVVGLISIKTPRLCLHIFVVEDFRGKRSLYRRNRCRSL